MNRRTLVSVAAVSLVCGLFAAESSAENTPSQGLKVSPLPATHPVVETLCGVEGQIILDPNDHTNGAQNYKGVVTFTAKQALSGVNLDLLGPYVCYCPLCPTGSSNVLGIQEGSNFAAGEKRSYFIRCASSTPTDGNVGRAAISRFVAGKSADTGAWVNASCGGNFAFLQKPPPARK